MLQLSRKERLENAKRKVEVVFVVLIFFVASRISQFLSASPGSIEFTTESFQSECRCPNIGREFETDLSTGKWMPSLQTPLYDSESKPPNMNTYIDSSSGQLPYKISTTPSTEKVAQISQELNLLVSSNFGTSEFCQQSSLSPSEAATASYSQTNELSRSANGERNFRTASHLSLPACWQGAPLSSVPSPSASLILIRELQQRNVELATLLEQRNETHDRSVAKVASLRDQLHQLKLSTDEEKRNLELSTQRELAKARDQVRAHSQTVGALVAEKTELQAKLAHVERVAEQRSRELQEMASNRNELHAKLQELEDRVHLATSSSEHSDSAKQEALRQLEQWRSEAKRENAFRTRLETELKNRDSKLSRLESELMKLTSSNEDLRRQLEVSMAFSRPGTVPERGTAAAPLGAPTTPTSRCGRCEAFQSRIHDLETMEIQTSADKSRLESQYKTYVSEMETQVKNLRGEVETANTRSETLQRSLDELRRQLTLKDSELTKAVSEFERLKSQLQLQESTVKSADPPPVTDKAILESVMYKDLELTANALRSKVNELSTRLSETEESLSVAEARLGDREEVLAKANSERTALSRAMDQNAKLKDQLTALHDALEHVNKENSEAQTALAKLQASAEETVDLRKKCERLEAELAAVRLETTSKSPLEDELRASLAAADARSQALAQQVDALRACEAELVAARAECAALRAALEKAERECAMKADALVVGEAEPKAGPAPPIGLDEGKVEVETLRQAVQDSDNKAQQVAALEREVDSLRLLSTSQAATIVSLEEALAATKGSDKHTPKRDSEVQVGAQRRDAYASCMCQTELSIVKSEETLSKLRQSLSESKTNYAQLEERFKQMTDRLAASNEEKSRLEAIVAQLEMESSTIGEYITMFAHRRQLQLKRARIRDALLARLVRDRNELRKRLQALSSLAKSVTSSLSDEDNSLSENHVHHPTLTTLEKELSDFLADLDTSSPPEDIHSDDDADDDGDVEAGGGGGLEGRHRPPTSLDDQLRQLAATTHDCPHCECCSGSLLVV
uniref:GOLGA2L5 domain-containing protein n=1 Tax=Mesocestoides corti TaxID=53468 RepID=A0A5K3FCT2_MESCO